MDKRIAVVGCGKAGLSIALALKAAGWEVDGCYSRSEESRRRGAQWLACRVFTSLSDIPEGAVVLLSVPDQSLRVVDRELADADAHLRRRVVVHLSGGLPSRILESCRLAGASVGSFHPIMAMPDPLTGARHLKTTTFAIEGRPEALSAMKVMAQSLSGRFFVLSPRGKILYHAAAVVASNHLVALLQDSQELLARAGVDPAAAFPAFESLVQSTVANVFASGTVGAITGPVERGDMEIVKNHLQAMKRTPGLRSRYASMLTGVIDLTRRRHPDRAESLDALEKMAAGCHPTPAEDE